MSYPTQLGQPCWTLKQVSRVIPAAATAQTSDDSIPYFLAAHSPFRRITDLKAASRTLTEEEIFKEVFSPGRGQVEAFVTGEPGTGKSHLIRWLRLRAGYAAARREGGLEKFKLVLVSRGTGSLKDALSQVVHQLGRDFRQHLRRVQTAIERISDSTARATLLSELALEVGSRWTNERRREPLPRELRHLSQALRAEGFGGWFKRDRGVIHQVIQRLTEQTSVEERESFPAFKPSDFDVSLDHLKTHDNSPEVLQFADDLKEEQDTRERAAEVLNTALQDAVRGLTGLKGSDLLEVFTEIRRELGPDKSLAVFIEDVSATSGGLDQDVINAFEPRGGDGLCRMVAVLGIVDSGWERLQKNQKDRGTHVYQVGGTAASTWAEDPAEVAQFTARYLNAVRSTDEEINAIAQGFFSSDGWQSKCDACPHKTPCHEKFGKVVLPHGMEVGTFPYTPFATQALLLKLGDTRYRSQRGLLTRILLPALDQSFKDFAAKQFPRPPLFAVHPPAFPVWTGFTNAYCSGANWDEAKRSSLRFLAQFWVAPGSAEELAAQLQPMLDPLGFPKFSRSLLPPGTLKVVLEQCKQGKKPSPADLAKWPELDKVGPLIAAWKEGHPLKASEVPISNPDLRAELVNSGIITETKRPPVDPELVRLLGLLDNWHTGQTLQEDNKFRDLAAECLTKCVVWEDYQGTPISEKRRLITGNRFPRIEGQTMKPGGSFFFDLNRSTATYGLLQSLLLLARSPGKTWSFQHGELHKRELSRWLRKNTSRVVASIQPDPASLPQDVLRPAVEALALAAHIRDRRKLPDARGERIHSLLAPIWDQASKPVILSPDLQAIADDLEQKHTALRDLIVQELGCGQGDAPPKDFINPAPVFDLLDEFQDGVEFHPAPSASEQGYWGPRFLAAKTLAREAFGTIPKRIEKEREAIGKESQATAAFIKKAGIEEFDPRVGLEKCLLEFVEVITLQRGAQHKKPVLPFPNEPFDQLWLRKLVQSSEVRASWSAAIARAAELAKDKDRASLLAFDPARLKEVADALKIMENHLGLIDQHLADEEGQGGPAGDSRPKLLASLQAIEELADTKDATNP